MSRSRHLTRLSGVLLQDPDFELDLDIKDKEDSDEEADSTSTFSVANESGEEDQVYFVTNPMQEGTLNAHQAEYAIKKYRSQR